MSYTSPYLIRILAVALVNGPWQEEPLVARCEKLLGRRRWVRPLVKRLVVAMPPGRRPNLHQVLQFLEEDSQFWRACSRFRWKSVAPEVDATMEPYSGSPRTWNVPAITTYGELATWLDVEPRQLDWFVDSRFLESQTRPGPLRHYHYKWLSKRRGGSARLLETPKPRLKWIQRRILRGILDQIPPHDAAHGFVRGRSIRTFVELHQGQAIVLRTDLRDFFPSVPGRRLVGIFRAAGYPELVAVRLAALCVNQAPGDIWATFPHYGPPWDRWRHERLYQQPHLPQGAPTSPSLANLAGFRLDCRLTGLARRFGARYTRYADDLLFSGPKRFAACSDQFLAYVTAIAHDEGFEIHGHKTRKMNGSQRQQAAGLVINQHPNLAREQYDRLKATLYNCVRNGPSGENRDGVADFRSHLEGRVNYVASINPARAAKLQALLRRIAWP